MYFLLTATHYIFYYALYIGVPPKVFRIVSLSPGSVIVDLEIHPEPSCPDPMSVAKNLEIQASDPSSRLRNGNITCHAIGIALPRLNPGTILGGLGGGGEGGVGVAVGVEPYSLQLLELQAHLKCWPTNPCRG
jgi:hypothetical protein